MVLSRAGHPTPAKKIHKRRKTHAKKKILAVFLSLCMAMSLLPVTALATGDEETETQTPTESSITTEEALKNAIDNTPAGGTVTLDKDIVITAPVVINKQITLDLNEKKIYAEKNIWNDKDKDWSLISVREKGDLTITGKGTLKALENDSYAVDVMDGGSCTIENGTFVGNIHAVYVSRGTLVVNGGTFSVQQKYQDETKAYEFVLNCFDANYKNGSSSITVNGGTFANFNPANCKAEGEGTSFMSSDCESTREDETTYWTVTKKATISVEKQENETGTVVDATVGGVTIPTGAGSGDITTEDQTLTLNATVTDGSDTVTTSNVTVGGTALNTIAEKENVANVAIETNVGTLTVSKAALEKIVESAEKAANNGITPDVTLSIEKVDTKDADKGVTYNVNATVAVGGTTKEVFTEASADSNATIQVSVPAPTGVTNENVHVYYLGPNGAEEIKATVAGEDSAKTVSWDVEHFSTYYLTGEEQVASITKSDGTTTTYGTLSEAVAAAQNGDTIVLLADITNNNVGTTAEGADTVLNINKSITIKGNGNEISIDLSVPSDFEDRDQVFSIGKDKTSTVAVTLDNVTMTITGKENGKGDAFDVWGTLNITNGSNITVKNAQSAFTMQGGENAKVNIEKSTVTANDINGNFSNGGEWAIKDDSTVNIKDCGTHGLSVEKLTVDASNVTVDGAKWVGIYASEMSFTNGANVTVTNCATDENIGTTYKDKGAVQLKHVESETPKLTIDDSTLTLKDNGNAANGQQVIYVGDGTLDNKGTINADKVDMAGADEFNITLVNNGDKSFAVTTSKSYTLPDYPNQGNNHFQGWRDQDGKNYEGGAKVENITKDMTFTAVWSYIPPANPNYKITIGDTEGGTVTADPAAAKAGATVTLTATPDEGYAVGTITVTDRFGDAVKVTENADGTYTFTMPNGQVTVKATFVETQEPAPAEPFPDVDENDWFYDEVVYVYENGLMNGVENNQFAPNTATNRAMLATILYRLAGEPAVSGDLPFTDVAAGTWYTDAVLWAAQNGIVNGLGENTFAPMNTLTREQLVTMLYRYAEAKGYDVSASADLSGYPDAGQVQDYAQPAMAWAVAENIIQGMEDGTLKPAGNASRAQIATILMRFCEDVAQ